MDDLSKTKAELLIELADLRRRLDDLEGNGGEGEEAADTLRRLASFPEQNPDPVIEIGRNGAVSYLNPIARERFPNLEREGTSHPALDGLASIFTALRAGERDEYVRVLEVGDYVYEQTMTGVGGTGLVRIFARDITEWRRAAVAARESQMRFHGIFEHSNDAIFLIDPARDEVLNVNSKACRMLGYDREELLSLPLAAVGASEERGMQDLDEVLRDAQGWTGELTCVTKGGQILSTEVSASRVRLAGRSSIIAVARDLTERRRAEQALADEVRAKYNFEEIIGQSTSLEGALQQVELVAPTDTSVLILGETGTGKELICRAIHHASRRSERPLVKLNCAAIPSGLIESELFGHEKGAFTGAVTQKQGRFELAHDGTIFLDEIGDLPLETQPKLLRLLQEQEFERVGGTRTIKVDVRVIAATHRDLEEMVRQGELREDLFYRLNVFPISLPPLRDRKEDIPVLARYFDQRVCARLGRPPSTFSTAAIERLINYAWPGNVRELENIVERAVILSDEGIIEEEQIQVQSGPVLVQAGPRVEQVGFRSLQEVEHDHIVAALRASKGKVSGKGGAAESLGLKPSTLESRMKKLDISRDVT